MRVRPNSDIRSGNPFPEQYSAVLVMSQLIHWIFIIVMCILPAVLGFRYALIDGDDKLNLRLDLAYNREGSPYVCFDVMEAF